MIKQRIVQLIENKKIAKEIFYKKIGMTSASFRGSAKETPINSNAIENILSEIPDVNLYWLITGKGKMLIENEINENKEDITVYHLNELLQIKQQKIEKLEKEIRLLKSDIKKQ